MRDREGAGVGLRRLWVAGGALFVVGFVLPVGDLVISGSGFALTSVAAGLTAARGREVHPGWLVLAWAVAVLPVLAFGGGLWWLWVQHADALAWYLLAQVGAVFVFAIGGVFVGALVVGLLRRPGRPSVRRAPACVEE